MKVLISILLCSAILIACKHPHSEYGNNKSIGKYYNIRGIKMYCEVYGEGPSLLMLHGNDGSISTYKYNIPYFEKNYKVILVDARAQGKSLDKTDSLTFQMMADDYAALLDSIHVDSAYVLGWSDGGISGLLLAIRHPQKVKKLAISGANLWPDTTAVLPEEWKNNVTELDSLNSKKNKTESVLHRIKMLRLDLNEPHIELNGLRRINCPTLVICGDHDIIRFEHTYLIFKNLPKAHLWVIPNTDHYTPMEHSWRFNLGINNFFSTTPIETYESPL